MSSSVPDWSGARFVWIVGGKGTDFRNVAPIKYDPRLFSEFSWPVDCPTNIYCDYDEKEADADSIVMVSISGRVSDRYLIAAFPHVRLSRRTKLLGLCSFHWETAIFHEDGSLNYTSHRRRKDLSLAR